MTTVSSELNWNHPDVSCCFVKYIIQKMKSMVIFISYDFFHKFDLCQSNSKGYGYVGVFFMILNQS